MEDIISYYKSFVGKPEARGLTEISTWRWENSIKIYL
jgi:hypothetical protein